jgi:hypothetical protein
LIGSVGVNKKYAVSLTSDDVFLEELPDDDADVGCADPVDVTVDGLLQRFPGKTLKL